MKNMNQGAFLSSLRLQLSSCYRVKIPVFPLTPNLGFTKVCFPARQSCVKTLLGCIVRFLEKRGQGRVFCECWVPYPLLPWLIETVLSDDFSARSGKKTVSLLKLKYLIKTVVEMRRKMDQCVFLADLRLQISNIHWWKIFALPSGPNSQVHKDLFPYSFRAVYRQSQDTMYHSMRKEVRRKCSVSVECHTCCYSD